MNTSIPKAAPVERTTFILDDILRRVQDYGNYRENAGVARNNGFFESAGSSLDNAARVMTEISDLLKAAGL